MCLASPILAGNINYPLLYFFFIHKARYGHNIIDSMLLFKIQFNQKLILFCFDFVLYLC